MKAIHFEWDDRKSEHNAKKHGITFQEAATVFYDEMAIEFYDDEHSEWEDRFLLLGLSEKLNLLLVCHSYKESEGIIRIISARKATKNESKFYFLRRVK
ncbi:MAG: BrnT family toxin [Deltaproteobacteria bacterium]|nr:MAG: BrnT family toxin [Deltaproteobacteria bacterium]